MTLAPNRSDEIRQALHELVEAAQEAFETSDLESARRCLGNMWFRINDAQHLINDAERETREAALAKLGEHA